MRTTIKHIGHNPPECKICRPSCTSYTAVPHIESGEPNWKCINKIRDAWTIQFSCRKCHKFLEERVMTDKEIISIAEETQKFHEETEKILKCMNNFRTTFMDKKGQFIYKDWDLIKKVMEWAEDWPEVKITNCDDRHFTSSIIVIIPCIGTKAVIYIPQYGVPAIFHLTKSNALALSKTLTKMVSKKYKKSSYI